MLRTDLMPASMHPALQERERVFNRIRVRVALNVDFQLVANRLMPSLLAEILRRAAVGVVVVREQNVYIFAQILARYIFSRVLGLDILRLEETEFTAALADADDDVFVIETCDFAVCFVHPPT